MRMSTARRGTRLSVAFLTLLTVAGLSGCGSSDGQSPAAAAASPTQSTGGAGSHVAPADLVKRVALVDGDFTDGMTVKLYQGGDVVDGQVTLDNCGGLFTTEAYRVARHQTALVSAKKRAYSFSNEVVAYDSADRAATALVELRDSVTHCPTNVFVNSAVQGVPDERYDTNKVSTSAGLSVKDNAVQTFVISAHGTKKHYYGMAVFQRQGTVLDIVYLASLKKLPPAAIATLNSLAQVTGKRLAAN